MTGLAAWYSGAERAVQYKLRELVSTGDSAIDVGANWGLHTLYLSKLVGPTGQVISIECFDAAVAELEWHVQVNNCQNVRVLPAALCDHDGTEVFTRGDSPTTGQLRTEESPVIDPAETVVRALTMDSLLKQPGFRPPSLVKIDVEGSEGRVLLGAEATVIKYRPRFIIELHNPDQDIFVARWLRKHDYHIERLTTPPILDFDKGWPEPRGVWGTIVALPN
jgi:FkbM family methyltransferase